MNNNMIAKIHSYWSKTEFGNMMIKSDYVSDSDLLFLIPNNKKKIIGLPMTRLGDKHNKRRYKNNRCRHIVAFKMFDILEEVIEQKISKLNFDNFVDYKDIRFGDKCNFTVKKEIIGYECK